VKFGARVWTCNTLPVLNFVEITGGGCPLGENFYQKIEIFANFSYLSPHVYTHNVTIVLMRMVGFKNPLTKQIFVKIPQLGLPVLHCPVEVMHIDF